LKLWCLLAAWASSKTPFLSGAVAQLIERFVRNEEVVGLIPICSTSFPAVASFLPGGDVFLPSGALDAPQGTVWSLLVSKAEARMLCPPND